MAEIVEIEEFLRDPIAEGRLKTLASYHPVSGDWRTPPIEELVDSSDFLVRSGRLRGMKREDIVDLARLLERIYRRMYRSYPVEPGKFAALMQHFFEVYEPGRGIETVYGEWLKRCSKHL